MRFLQIIVLLFISTNSFATGGTSGGGPGSVLTDQQQVQDFQDFMDRFGGDAGGGLTVNPNLRDFGGDAGGGLTVNPRLREIIILNEDVVDVTDKDYGVIDMHSLKDIYGSKVHKGELGQWYIEKDVPIRDFQTLDGQIHQIQLQMN